MRLRICQIASPVFSGARHPRALREAEIRIRYWSPRGAGSQRETGPRWFDQIGRPLTREYSPMRKRIVLAAVAATALAGFAPMASAATSTEVVTNADVSRQVEDSTPLMSKVIYTRAASPGTGTFRAGPSTPPLGTGSLELSTTTGSDK